MGPSVLASFLNPEGLVRHGGLLLAALMVFAESGLLVGFFLPGDSLLFIAGFLTSAAGKEVLPPLPLTIAVLFIAAVIGDQVGYFFGAKTGPSLFSRPDSRFFRRDHLQKAERFFDRHGAKTIVLARFVPIVRTFAPIVAGASRMKYRTFVMFNVVGAFLWVVGVTTLGYFLGQVSWIKNNIELAIVAVIAISLMPMVIEYVRHRRSRRQPALPPLDEAA